MQYLAHRQEQDDGVGDDIDDDKSIPKGGFVGAGCIFDTLIPRSRYRYALRDSRDSRTDCEGGDDGECDVASQSEWLGGEDAEVEHQDGNLIEADNNLVHDLRNVEVL